MTKIVILGAGSIGCWIGGHLIASGLNVSLLGRERYAAEIAKNGLTLTHFERDDVICRDVDFQTTPAVLTDADIIGLCVKSQDTAHAAQQIAEHAPKAMVVSFQNGIRNSETLREILPPQRVIPAIVPFNVTPTQPGGFHCGTAGALVVKTNSQISPLVQALIASGQEVRQVETIIGDQWAKMIVNLNNGLNTLSGGTLREGLLQREYRCALAASVEEALAVADGNGVRVGQFNGRSPAALVKTLRLPNFAYRIIMQMIVKIDAQARSSMLDDLEAGRPSEIDFLQGEIVKQAKSIGQAAPVNASILDAVKAAFDQGRSPKLSGAELYRLIK